MEYLDAAKAKPEKPAFGRWLLNQRLGGHAPGDVKALAEVASQDRGFPRDGTPEQVSAHLNRAMADKESHEALESAVASWRYE